MSSATTDRNTEILAERTARFDARTGPRLGDFIRTSDGQYLRITHDWDTHVQTSDGRFGMSFYLNPEGHLTYSGGLDPGLPTRFLRSTGELRDGSCWFFDRGIPGAGRGIDVTIPCRVFACDFTAEECRRGVVDWELAVGDPPDDQEVCDG